MGTIFLMIVGAVEVALGKPHICFSEQVVVASMSFSFVHKIQVSLVFRWCSEFLGIFPHQSDSSCGIHHSLLRDKVGNTGTLCRS